MGNGRCKVEVKWCEKNKNGLKLGDEMTNNDNDKQRTPPMTNNGHPQWQTTDTPNDKQRTNDKPFVRDK